MKSIIILFILFFTLGCTTPEELPCIKEETTKAFCERVGEEIKATWFQDADISDLPTTLTPVGDGFVNNTGACCIKTVNHLGVPTQDHCNFETGFEKLCLERATPETIKDKVKSFSDSFKDTNKEE